ncbi:hypothetical protein GCM10009718_33990 [Isoptericola halotolerans]|uniref:Adhesin domain-containing protein n=1 Tax=Isoptericola halotolerans TaxID=300560 RepID=A0ABX2A2G4_9MICO|nr:hypothetical protein [Isoptericola halotolerans]NOV97047.1 hypothetical protein [Isoptericola halotolerans]
MTTSTPGPAPEPTTYPGPPTDPHPAPGPPSDPRRSPAGRALLVVGLVLGGLLVAWGALHLVDRALSSTTTTREDYDAAASLELVTDGEIDVRAEDGATGVDVEVVARRGLVAPSYAVDEVDGGLVLTHRCPSWAWFSWVCSGELRAVVPPDTDVVARASNGDVRASGLDGGAELRSANGAVFAAVIGGDLVARSSNGDVVVHDVAGDLEARSANGALELARVGGRVTATTGNGGVQVSDAGGFVTARSSNGSVSVTTAGGDVEARTANGRVDVAGAAGDVLARSSNGAVTVIGDGEPVALTIGTSNGRETVEGLTDPGAPRTVEIRSSNGDVAYLAP